MATQKNEPVKKAGIWIDQEQAFLFVVSGEKSTQPARMEKIESNIESRERVPGQGSDFVRFGSVNFNQESDKQHRQHNERLKYFKQIIDSLQDIDYLYIFGPSDAKDELNNAIEKEGRHFKCRVIAIDSADKMTTNQMQEKSNRYFESQSFQDAKSRLVNQIKGD